MLCGNVWTGDVLHLCLSFLLTTPPLTHRKGLHGYSMQELIDHWHMQETLHAGVYAPPLLALQIGRFDFSQQDECAIKRRFAVIPNQLLLFLCLMGTMLCCSTRMSSDPRLYIRAELRTVVIISPSCLKTTRLGMLMMGCPLF